MEGIAEAILQMKAAKQWEKIGLRHHHGINVPLFSLRGKQSGGIGEFLDVLPLIDWCKEVGFDVIQLLPLNDTGIDVSPYSAISGYALNPLHLTLAKLPGIEENPEFQSIIDQLLLLNAFSRVEYAKVRTLKERFLNEYYAFVSEKIIASESFQSFLKEHEGWLFNFALFKTLKDCNRWLPWKEWHPNHQSLSKEKRDELLNTYEKEIHFHCFVQHLCFEQMEEVKRYAFSSGVFLKGDIPILINRESADVWANPELFRLEYSAGAPPDMYTEDGQNWGFPIYNWEALEQQDFSWWKQRLKVAGHFYHLYRLDHVIGFFRIWAIPAMETSAKQGHFIPQDPSLWFEHGRKILQVLLDASEMLPIGEDLGVVPRDVRICLNLLGVAGTKVMRWERRWNEDQSFIPFNEYPFDSMTTVSTHDSETLQQWWELFPDDAKKYACFKNWIYHSKLSPTYHLEYLRDSHRTTSLFHINLLQEYLFLIPEMAWPNPEDDRINIPGLVLDRNWTYRFRPFIEEIVSSQVLKQVIQDVLQ